MSRLASTGSVSNRSSAIRDSFPVIPTVPGRRRGGLVRDAVARLLGRRELHVANELRRRRAGGALARDHSKRVALPGVRRKRNRQTIISHIGQKYLRPLNSQTNIPVAPSTSDTAPCTAEGAVPAYVKLCVQCATTRKEQPFQARPPGPKVASAGDRPGNGYRESEHEPKFVIRHRAVRGQPLFANAFDRFEIQSLT